MLNHNWLVRLYILAFFILPKRALSKLVGYLVEVRRPKRLAKAALKFFVRLSGANLSEAELPLESYPNIGAFFRRRLKLSARTAENSPLISPVDGLLRSAGEIDSNTEFRIKGGTYKISTLLGEKNNYDFKDGFYFNFYLSPKDYHRVHFPLSGEISNLYKIGGSLFPVNELFHSSLKDLYVRNERLVCLLNSQHGAAALVMIAALNVGDIKITADSAKNTIKAFQEFAYFQMGSAVVLLLNHNWRQNFNFAAHHQRTVKIGETLVELVK
ncbi:MAG TPA: archaetidylserine decarboxylase [Oligoflexia bacterium]|nr:archaetidylserine decarboxylase [Oligoflexia bacterium]HMP26792.1 archaetidylserine decarboxylase [Oligoflexia bacterium]